MKSYYYFLIALTILLVSLGATAPIAATAGFAISAILFVGGLYTKFVVRYN